MELSANQNNPTIIQLPDFNGLSCYICTEIYSQDKKPLILVCGHTFCETCLTILFDKCKEIQCSFCKIITKLEKFDDMIINYSILNLCEFITTNKNKTSGIFNNSKNPKFLNSLQNNSNKNICECLKFLNFNEIDKLLECQDCEVITCKDCLNTHRDHKLTNIVDFIEAKSETLLKTCNNYKDLSAKMAYLLKKIDKNELEKSIKIEKEKLNVFLKEIKNFFEKNCEMISLSMDKLYKDYVLAIDEYKKDIKIFNSDSQRYYNIISEFNNFHKIENKERQKLLKVYNLNQFMNEIKIFNENVNDKLNGLIGIEVFVKDFNNRLKNIFLYKNKIQKVVKLSNEKITKEINKNIKVYFFKSFKRI